MFKERVKTHHRGKKGPNLPVLRRTIDKFLQTTPKQKEGVIYFHVPFCDNICSFCSMNRSKLDGQLDEYCEFLLKKIDEFCDYPYIKQKEFESIYFGGGTPTIFKNHHLEKILKAINEKFNISPTCEFSFESTLHNLNMEKLRLMQDLGVNRYSIGIQSFNDEGRKLLNRVGDGKHAIDKLSKIKSNFKGNICIDIIYNYPNQSLKDVINDAKMAKELEVDSASFYSLMFHEGSKLSEDIRLEDYYDLKHDNALHNHFVEEMLKDDYEILELTKVNKKGRDKYKYIRLTHQGADILPLGIGAGGRLGEYGSFTFSKFGKAMQVFTKKSEKEQRLDAIDWLFQYQNIKLEKLKNLVNNKAYEEIFDFLKKTEEHQYIRLNDEEINFTINGIFWGNTIASHVLDIAQKY
ncbi:MAG: radical SAM protein [Proteobacteria bacterium]|nr:MAG: radical SAM protein [Pseudomonadota bacterium]